MIKETQENLQKALNLTYDESEQIMQQTLMATAQNTEKLHNMELREQKMIKY